jgi:hypothetical protein
VGPTAKRKNAEHLQGLPASQSTPATQHGVGSNNAVQMQPDLPTGHCCIAPEVKQPTVPSFRKPQGLPKGQLIAAHSGGSVSVGGLVGGGVVSSLPTHFGPSLVSMQSGLSPLHLTFEQVIDPGHDPSSCAGTPPLHLQRPTSDKIM